MEEVWAGKGAGVPGRQRWTGVPWQDYAGPGPGDLGEGQLDRAEKDGSIRGLLESHRLPVPGGLSGWIYFSRLQKAGQLGLCLSSLLPGCPQSSSLGGRMESGPACNSSFLLPTPSGPGELEDPEDGPRSTPPAYPIYRPRLE